MRYTFFMLTAILFDIDGVLIDSFDANLLFFQNLLPAFGYRKITAEEYRGMFHLTMIDVIKRISGLPDGPELDDIMTRAKSRVDYVHQLVKLSDGVEVVVQKLATKYQLALVTSRIRIGVTDLPVLAPLLPLFQTVVAYEDTKNHKPHPKPLLLAIERLNVQPAEAVYVGDAETDFIAARAAEVKAIMYKNHEVKNADGYVESFADLEQEIGSLS